MSWYPGKFLEKFTSKLRGEKLSDKEIYVRVEKDGRKLIGVKFTKENGMIKMYEIAFMDMLNVIANECNLKLSFEELF